jgi:hypothetical protein
MLLNVIITFKCVCVANEFNVREDNERESGYHGYYNVGEESKHGFRRHYQEKKDYMLTPTYPSNVGDEFP